MIEKNVEYGDQISKYNQRMGSNESESVLKSLRHEGVVRLPEWAPISWSNYECPFTKIKYFDPDSQNYWEVMKVCWPYAMQHLAVSNTETAGDLIAASLGYYYFLTVRQNIKLDAVVVDFVHMLESASIFTYLKNNIYG